jgi:universal stress protein family protein
MKKIIAALDDSLAATPVLTTASMLGKVFGAAVEAVHVAVDGGRVVQAAADSAAVPLELLSGDVVETVVTAASHPDVVVTVVGARATPGSARPLGTTALAIARALTSPLVAVPPDARPVDELRRVLVPVEGDVSTAPVPGGIVEIVQSAGARAIEVVVLHVLEERRLPAFTDQPQHEHPAWAQEFVRRFCPWGIGGVSLQTRVGRTDEVVPEAAQDLEVDLVALGWAQELAAGRARVVRATLRRGGVPVMLVPVRMVVDADDEELSRGGSQLSRA